MKEFATRQAISPLSHFRELFTSPHTLTHIQHMSHLSSVPKFQATADQPVIAIVMAKALSPKQLTLRPENHTVYNLENSTRFSILAYAGYILS